MAVKQIKLAIDYSVNKFQKLPIIIQYDDGVGLHITVTDNGTASNLTGLTCEVSAKKPDGKVVVQDNGFTISSNIITGVLSDQFFTQHGEMLFDVHLKNASTSLAIFQTEIKVYQAAVQDRDIESVTEHRVITQLLTKLEDIEQYEDTRRASEISRVSAENARVASFTDIEQRAEACLPIIEASADMIRDANIDYFGDAHGNIKDAMDSNFAKTKDAVFSELNTMEYSGQYITVENGVSEKIPHGTIYGKSLTNALQGARRYIDAEQISPTRHKLIGNGAENKKSKIEYSVIGGEVKHNTYYTIDFFIYQNTVSYDAEPNRATVGKFNMNSYNVGTVSIYNLHTGHYTYEILTDDVNTHDGLPYLETFSGAKGILDIGVVVREGKDLAPIPNHFDGIGAVKTPTLQSHGKNILDETKPIHISHYKPVKFEAGKLVFDTLKNLSSTGRASSFFAVQLENGMTYKISYQNIETDTQGLMTTASVQLQNPQTETEIAIDIRSSYTHQLPSGIYNLRPYSEKGVVGYATFNIMVEQVSENIATPYAPYKSSELKPLESFELCDEDSTYNPITGDITRNSNKYTFVGTEKFSIHSSQPADTNLIRFRCPIPKELNPYNTGDSPRSIAILRCDTLLVYETPFVQLNSVGIATTTGIYNDDVNCYVVVEKSVANDSSEFATWVSNNNFTVVFKTQTTMHEKVETQGDFVSFDGVNHFSSTSDGLIPQLKLEVPVEFKKTIGESVAKVGDANVDYMGRKHENIREAMNENVKYTISRTIGEMNTLNYVGQNITATNTIAENVGQLHEGTDKSVVLSGMTLVNECNITTKDRLFSWKSPIYPTKMLKRNTKYMAIYDVKTVTSNADGVYSRITYSDGSFTSLADKNFSVGVEKFIFTTKDLDVTQWYCCYIRSEGSTVTFNGITFIEYQDGMENWGVEYFEGMQSVKSPVLCTTGKNLFNVDNIVNHTASRGILTNNDGVVTVKGTTTANKECMIISESGKIFLEKGVEYTFKYEANAPTTSELGVRSAEMYWCKDGAYEHYFQILGTRVYTVAESGWYYPRFDVNKGDEIVDFWNLQVIRGSDVNSSYEPYKTTILSTSEPIELLSAESTLNCSTGEVYEPYIKAKFKGEENWYYHDNIKGMVCKDYTHISLLASTGIVKVQAWDGTVMYCLKASDYPAITSLSAGLEYLKANPIEVVIKTRAPIVKTVELIGDVVSYDGTTHYMTSSDGLSPMLNIDVPTKVNAVVAKQREIISAQNTVIKEQEEAQNVMLNYQLSMYESMRSTMRVADQTPQYILDLYELAYDRGVREREEHI